MTIVAAADGSALGNPGPAGWAWYVDENCWRAGGWPHGTNNMGELMAVLDLFKSTEHVPEEPLHILCDSQYVINCITKWMPGWKRKGWRKADGKPVLNLELLKDIDAAILGRKYTFEWVKGHAGHDLNEAADDRARDAATAYQAKRTPNAGPGFPGAGSPTAEPAAESGAESDPVATVEPPAAPMQQAPAAPMQQAPADEVQPDLFSMLEDDLDPSFPAGRDASLEAVVQLERELLDPAVRADPLRASELLHPDFEEIGASGRRLSRQEALAMFSDETAGHTSLEVLTLNRLDDSTALLTYRSDAPDGSALRSSIWQFASGRWQVRFHQGTSEA
ncbi:ribonuclease HI family protein [Arthrobacter sp. H35-D1]|uniref:ribonuclease HI family protein n=1 Tax=Arthrobacter sp. H35-D1 TaxID=3046202 RepID=UPI0024B9BC49|nr:ribonuclease HI family protein [Arthrobacter sp. H35-D1]MDJ0314448.1 ribonuclease HI family protein [Arthrobacter sp. H35-D1]